MSIQLAYALKNIELTSIELMFPINSVNPIGTCIQCLGGAANLISVYVQEISANTN